MPSRREAIATNTKPKKLGGAERKTRVYFNLLRMCNFQDWSTPHGFHSLMLTGVMTTKLILRS